MSNDYTTTIFDPIKSLELAQNRSPVEGNWAYRGVVNTERAIADRLKALHTFDVDLISAGATTLSAVANWTLFCGSLIPLVSRAVSNDFKTQFLLALSTSLKVVKFVMAAVVSPFAGVINPSWSVTLHEKMGLHECQSISPLTDDNNVCKRLQASEMVELVAQNLKQFEVCLFTKKIFQLNGFDIPSYEKITEQEKELLTEVLFDHIKTLPNDVLSDEEVTKILLSLKLCLVDIFLHRSVDRERILSGRKKIYQMFHVLSSAFESRFNPIVGKFNREIATKLSTCSSSEIRMSQHQFCSESFMGDFLVQFIKKFPEVIDNMLIGESGIEGVLKAVDSIRDLSSTLYHVKSLISLRNCEKVATFEAANLTMRAESFDLDNLHRLDSSLISGFFKQHRDTVKRLRNDRFHSKEYMNVYTHAIVSDFHRFSKKEFERVIKNKLFNPHNGFYQRSLRQIHSMVMVNLSNMKKGAHRLLLRADPVNEIFHFYDPNTGISKEFENRDELISRFADYMVSMYQDEYDFVWFSQNPTI